MLSRRTDLAAEARTIWSEDSGAGDLPGVTEEERELMGFSVTTVRVRSDRAAEELCKPKGEYVTLELGRFLRREDGAFPDGAKAIGRLLREMIGRRRAREVLVVGLGNPAITPDAVGHLTVGSTIVTRHLRQMMPEQFRSLASVAAVEPGVLGTTGVESAQVVRSIVGEVRPELVIAVDALASRSMDRVCRTVQIADTGIVPGSGVGGGREPLNRESLGIPVIAMGVPTVVDAATLALDMAAEAGVKLRPEDLSCRDGSMIVTPRDIDFTVRDISRLIGYGINCALHPELSVADMDMMLG